MKVSFRARQCLESEDDGSCFCSMNDFFGCDREQEHEHANTTFWANSANIVFR